MAVVVAVAAMNFTNVTFRLVKQQLKFKIIILPVEIAAFDLLAFGLAATRHSLEPVAGTPFDGY